MIEWLKGTNIAFDLAQSIFIFLGFLYAFLTRQSKSNESEINELRNQIAQQNERIEAQNKNIALICQELKALPGHDDLRTLIERMDSRISNMNGELRELKGSHAALVRQHNVLNDYLLNKDKP